MPESIPLIPYPELVFALSGPIGVDMGLVENCLIECLKAVHYTSYSIKLTEEMYKFDISITRRSGENFLDSTRSKIADANALCEKNNLRDLMARLGILAIQRERGLLSGAPDKPVAKTAYIVRQLKRREEVDLLRRVYGKQFFLISAYGAINDRKKMLFDRMRDTMPASMNKLEIEHLAAGLIAQDEEEASQPFGQDLRETYHQADVFVGGMSLQTTAPDLARFVQALFGRTDITPSKAEYGMYVAKSAALRSADLSRQVGAALLSSEGDVIAQGCNEVPKAHGGTYWDAEEPDHRDVRVGKDPNERIKLHILRELFERLVTAKLLSTELLEHGTADQIVDLLTSKRQRAEAPAGLLRGASVMDLTEYGRVVHAEMCVICDSARIGRPIGGAILYCTTFPCHNCAKHILAAGISKVVYIEPYPKSRAQELHENEISIEVEVAGKISFIPFLGISPFRYRDIFQKGRRKNVDGSAKTWVSDEPRPMTESVAAAYLTNEAFVFAQMSGDVTGSTPQITTTSKSEAG